MKQCNFFFSNLQIGQIVGCENALWVPLKFKICPIKIKLGCDRVGLLNDPEKSTRQDLKAEEKFLGCVTPWSTGAFIIG